LLVEDLRLKKSTDQLKPAQATLLTVKSTSIVDHASTILAKNLSAVAISGIANV
jgi:hypothetical protein